MDGSLSARDRQVIWHPYTQHKLNLPPIAVREGKGSLLFDENGRSYIDAISSWWVTTHGHAHPYIAERIFEQARRLEHVIFTGFTHEPAINLAERLLQELPGPFSKIFYSDNGSTAVEVAIKMAIQFWRNTGAPRSRILAFRHSYHGDTFGAMSVSERSVFTASFEDYLFEVEFIDTPTMGNIAGIEHQIREHRDSIACFLYEPLLQGAGGMRMYDAALLDRLLAAARAGGALLLADEVLTGFGRTGKLFAGEYLRNQADIICLSKGLTAGTMALGVTAATEKVFEAFLSEDRKKTFFHGHSFTANPLACTAALASLDLLEKEHSLTKIRGISSRHETFAAKIGSHPLVSQVRILGTVLAFEIRSGKDEYVNSISAILTEQALLSGIYLRPLGNTVYILPPYCITEKETDQVYDFLVRFLETL
jgi:adenosylmethionine-8-amino-7-oxononanoate aminotransferase